MEVDSSSSCQSIEDQLEIPFIAYTYKQALRLHYKSKVTSLATLLGQHLYESFPVLVCLTLVISVRTKIAVVM